MFGLGTIINVAAIVVGGILGLLFVFHVDSSFRIIYIRFYKQILVAHFARASTAARS